MNVRSAILKRLEARQMSEAELLKLDFLDRLIKRTLARMVRNGRLEEYEGVYSLPNKMVKTNVVTHAVTIDIPVVEEVVDPINGVEVLEQLSETLTSMSDAEREQLVKILNKPVKDVVMAMPAYTTAELDILKGAELIGKARKSLVAAFEKLED